MALLFKDGDYVRIDRKRSVDVERRPRARAMGFRSGASSVAMLAALAFTGAADQAAAASTCGDGSPVTDGATCGLGNFNPVDNDGEVGAAIATGGDRITLTGLASDIAVGDWGLNWGRLGDFDPSAEGVQRLTLGAQATGVATPDPITGGTKVISTYSSSAFNVGDWGDHVLTGHHDVNDKMYIDARLGTARTGTLAVDIGDGSQAINAGANLIKMALKQSELTLADGAGSTVEWTSRNTVFSDISRAAPNSGVGVAMQIPVYAGTFTGFDGSSYTVNNVDDLKIYNDRLVAALGSGELNSQAAYNTEFAKAVTFAQQGALVPVTVTPGDEVTLPVGINSVIHADGAGALGVIRPGAQLDVVLVGGGRGLWASNGGTIQVDAGGKYSSIENGVFIESGGKGINNGVISGGFLSAEGLDTSKDKPGSPVPHYAISPTVAVTGTGSSFESNGIMNIAGWGHTPGAVEWATNYAVQSGQGATVTNNGIINVGVNPGITSGRVAGIFVRGSSSATNPTSATNAADGEIYIGRAAQYNVFAPEAVVDVANNLRSVGILVDGSNTNVRNDGNIIIGGLTQNAIGMKVGDNGYSTANSVVENRGTISVRGAAGGSPLENVGLLAEDSGNATVLNAGLIELTGVNGTGLKVLSTGAVGAAASSTGTIDVAGGADPTSGTRNFGVWAEGANATADIAAGEVNLSGTGAIGVHARAGATVNIEAPASINFRSGTDQVGYFTHGEGSTITNAASALEVSTERSTLFRVEDGASLVAPGDLTASGKDSTIIVASGLGATVDAGDSRLNVTGQNAAGIRVDGGATGHLRSGTTVSLDGDHADAGIVDGRKIDLTGTPSSETYSSVLTNEADISSSASNVTGFITRSEGTLVNHGAIVLSGLNSTGVFAHDGGILNNDGDITVANGTGIHVSGADSASQLSNDGTITVNDGVAGIYIDRHAALNATSGTGSIVTDGSAHGVEVGVLATGLQLGANTITVNGTGNGIENAARIGEIGLAGTTINVGDGAGIRTGVGIDPNASVTINVHGSGDGFAFHDAVGYSSGRVYGDWTTDADLVLGNGYVINANGVGATGIRANTSGAIDTSAQVTVTDAAGGSALVGGPASRIVNNGSLVSSSMAAPTVDVTGAQVFGPPTPDPIGTVPFVTPDFVNRGTISAPVDGLAILGGREGGRSGRWRRHLRDERRHLHR